MPTPSERLDDARAVPMPPPRIIADRGEFVDALGALARGSVMVRVSGLAGGVAIDGRPVYRSADTLVSYGLVQRFDNAAGFPGIEYYRLSREGRAFAERALAGWRRRPWLERLAVRFAG